MLSYLDSMYNKGFWITDPLGNNEFSYKNREYKKIYVPNLIEADITDIEISNLEAFIEINDNGIEDVSYGLKYFIKQKNIYLFDNHNHCYYFYKNFLRDNNLDKLSFVHIDQHKDMRDPKRYFEDFLESNSYKELKESFIEENFVLENIDKELFDSFLYTNFELNVGNFIKPLLKEDKIEELFIIDSEYKMDEFEKIRVNFKYVLDLDLDFFSDDMDYIDRDRRISFVKKIAKDADAIFIATSPYFISFERAKKALYDIFVIENN